MALVEVAMSGLNRVSGENLSEDLNFQPIPGREPLKQII